MLVFSHGTFLTHSSRQRRSTDATEMNNRTSKAMCWEAGGPSASLFLPHPYLHTSTIIYAYQLLQVQENDIPVAWISPEEKKNSHSFRWAMDKLTLKLKQDQNNETVR